MHVCTYIHIYIYILYTHIYKYIYIYTYIYILADAKDLGDPHLVVSWVREMWDKVSTMHYHAWQDCIAHNAADKVGQHLVAWANQVQGHGMVFCRDGCLQICFAAVGLFSFFTDMCLQGCVAEFGLQSLFSRHRCFCIYVKLICCC